MAFSHSLLKQLLNPGAVLHGWLSPVTLIMRPNVDQEYFLFSDHNGHRDPVTAGNTYCTKLLVNR
ncbi:MAG: hypothetical protein EPN25_10425 [Nitrospirae bacterium]|nr:MAG: hypothetical protein EPN25_10425 [Nitrospirota bacterium]